MFSSLYSILNIRLNRYCSIPHGIIIKFNKFFFISVTTRVQYTEMGDCVIRIVRCIVTVHVYQVNFSDGVQTYFTHTHTHAGDVKFSRSPNMAKHHILFYRLLDQTENIFSASTYTHTQTLTYKYIYTFHTHTRTHTHAYIYVHVF